MRKELVELGKVYLGTIESEFRWMELEVAAEADQLAAQRMQAATSGWRDEWLAAEVIWWRRYDSDD